MSNPSPTGPTTTPQGEAPARSLGVWQKNQARLSYLLVIGALVGILELGHSTHWSIPAISSGEKGASDSDSGRNELISSKSATTTPAAATPAGPAQEIPLDDHRLLKAGIKLHPVSQRSVDAVVSSHGTVDYNKNLTARLSTRVSGTVWRIEKQVGQTIRKGDVLAIVEAIEVGRMKSELLQAVVQQDLKQRTMERVESAGSALPEKLLNEAKSDHRAARIRVQNAIQSLVNLGLPIAADEVQGLDDEQLARKLQFLGLPESVVALLDPRTTTANLLPLCAPFDGVVIGREMTIGETVSPTDSHFDVADISRMWVTLDIRKEDVNLIRLGQPIDFIADGIAGTVSGQIDWISTEVDENSRTLQVRAEVENPVVHPATAQHCEQRLLRAKTFGTGQITVRSSVLSTVVPSEAVQFDGQEYLVFVREGQGFRRTPVVPGVVEKGQTEIMNDLPAGTLVATGGSHVVKAEFQLALTRN